MFVLSSSCLCKYYFKHNIRILHLHMSVMKVERNILLILSLLSLPFAQDFCNCSTIFHSTSNHGEHSLYEVLDVFVCTEMTRISRFLQQLDNPPQHQQSLWTFFTSWFRCSVFVETFFTRQFRCCICLYFCVQKSQEY